LKIAGRGAFFSVFISLPTSPTKVATHPLPAEINLGAASMEQEYQQARVDLNGKTEQPSSLVFYAAVLKDAPTKAGQPNSRVVARARGAPNPDALPLRRPW